MSRVANPVKELIQADHQMVRELFALYDAAKDADDSHEKSEIAANICEELTIHARMEEEIFYPALRVADAKVELLDEAVVEHASLKQLIRDIELSAPSEPLYDAKIKVLQEYVEHHVREEESGIFKLLDKSGIDAEAMAEDMENFKEDYEDAGSGPHK